MGIQGHLSRVLSPLISKGLSYTGKRIDFLNDEELLLRITSGSDFLRWGDGESALLFGLSVPFQRSSPITMASLLLSWLRNMGVDGFIVGLPKPALDQKGTNLEGLPEDSLVAETWFLTRLLIVLTGPWIPNGQLCGDALVFRNNKALKASVLTYISNYPGKVLHVGSSMSDLALAHVAAGRFFSIPTPEKSALSLKSKTLSEVERWLRGVELSEPTPTRPLIVISAGPLGKLVGSRFAGRAQVLDLGFWFR